MGCCGLEQGGAMKDFPTRFSSRMMGLWRSMARPVVRWVVEHMDDDDDEEEEGSSMVRRMAVAAWEVQSMSMPFIVWGVRKLWRK